MGEERGLLRSDLLGGARCASLSVLGTLFDTAYIIDMFSVIVGLFDGVNDDASEGEGDKHHDPARQVFVQVWGRGGIHAEGTGGTCRLDGFIETGKAGEGKRVIGESGHDPVNESLVAGITEEVCRLGVNNQTPLN